MAYVGLRVSTGAPATPIVPRERVFRKRDILDIRTSSLDAIEAQLRGLTQRLERERDEALRLAALIRGTIETTAGCWKLKDLIELICITAGISLITLRSDRREAEVVRPRQVYFWLARRFSTASFPQIGRTMGGRDHTTVMHGAARVQEIVDTLTPPEEETPVAWVKLLTTCVWPGPKSRLQKR